ncbi:c21ff612-e8cc-49cb-afda-36cf764f40fb [Thermothielavioides terrestris]|uniref:Efficient mitochondria targeting-associated protein 19 n=1 Tax=Thermothielavioides terrestris TaxID=2587410 RepID=A0A446BRA0_9PEZI|nr:c21ff612-e8cc-49cb-afda-36cf764f40fb [Thermothielavioides terrestris]
MATYNNTWRNKAWMGWFLLQVPLIFFIDLLEYLYPAWVYEPTGAPLHAFYALKQWYIQMYNDPIVQWSPETASGHDSWIGLFLHVEFLFLLPTVLYGVYRLAVQRRGTSGADELLFLVYALEVAFTTLVCIHDTYYLDSAVYSDELKRTLRFQFYGPWCLIPAIGAIDMASRILGRIKAADAVLEGRKSQ